MTVVTGETGAGKTMVVTAVGLLLGNAAMVSWQAADATGDSILRLDSGDIHVSQDGPRGAPALVLIHGLDAFSSAGLPVTAGCRNAPTGTNGSSAAVRTSVGTVIRSMVRSALARW